MTEGAEPNSSACLVSGLRRSMRAADRAAGSLASREAKGGTEVVGPGLEQLAERDPASRVGPLTQQVQALEIGRLLLRALRSSPVTRSVSAPRQGPSPAGSAGSPCGSAARSPWPCPTTSSRRSCAPRCPGATRSSAARPHRGGPHDAARGARPGNGRERGRRCQASMLARAAVPLVSRRRRGSRMVKTELSHQTWGPWPTVRLATEAVAVEVAGEVGARVISLRDLRRDREWLVQGEPPTELEQMAWAEEGRALRPARVVRLGRVPAHDTRVRRSARSLRTRAARPR